LGSIYKLSHRYLVTNRKKAESKTPPSQFTGLSLAWRSKLGLPAWLITTNSVVHAMSVQCHLLGHQPSLASRTGARHAPPALPKVVNNPKGGHELYAHAAQREVTLINGRPLASRESHSWDNLGRRPCLGERSRPTGPKRNHTNQFVGESSSRGTTDTTLRPRCTP
jgi:hypothetical protein